uniref:Uncharacterized protein n=1 Tax=Rangifer tarandus platyrhynchus TaxID=3082113 RepID=A0ACB0EI12_RANTA|nr:unnamed protein product [Rangifer tarandus platyrhynchus]
MCRRVDCTCGHEKALEQRALWAGAAPSRLQHSPSEGWAALPSQGRSAVTSGLVRLPSSYTASSLKPSLAIRKKSNGNVILRLSAGGWKWAQDEERTRQKNVPLSPCHPEATGRSESVRTPKATASGLRHRPTPWRRWEENDASSSQAVRSSAEITSLLRYPQSMALCSGNRSLC